MSIISITPYYVGQVGQGIARWKMITTDNLATITAAGYLNQSNLMGFTVSPLSIFDVEYNYTGSINQPGTGTYVELIPSITFTGGYPVITLNEVSQSGVPVSVAGDFVTFSNTSGGLADSGISPSDPLKTKAVMAGSAVVIGYIAHFVDTAGTIDDTAGAVTNPGSIYAGLDAVAGVLRSYPATTATGYLGLTAVSNSGAFNTIISNAAMGQTTTVSIPNPGAATANFVLDTGNATSVSTLNLKYGATPVAQVDPASCTITAAAGASNTSTITIQLKDGSGTNIARSVAFRVYSSSAADGLTLQSAASTGYSVASGGLSLANGTAVTTQISAMSSATGGCVLSLLDTGKQTSYLVLVLPNGNKISAQLSAGSYGA